MPWFFRLLAGCAFGALSLSCSVSAAPQATPTGPLVIEDEAPEGSSTVPLSTGAIEIPSIASPALDLFDPANPDPTYIPSNKRFAVPGQETSLPARLENPETIPGFPPSQLDFPLATDGFSLTASASDGSLQTASGSPPGDRALWPMLSPSIIRGANFQAAIQAAAEEAQTTTLEGHLIPEDQPLSRRMSFRRWALQTLNGERYPLTSNLTLLAAVKKKGILDIKVSVTGRWTQAKGEKRLRFLSPEAVRAMEEVPETGDKKPSDAKKSGAPAVISPEGGFASAPLGKSTASAAVIIPPSQR